jgi:hypothetical protein
MEPVILPQLFLPEAASRRLLATVEELLALAHAGQISHVVINSEIYFTAEDLAEFVRKNRIPAREAVRQ